MMKKQAINGMEGDQPYLNKTPMAEGRPSAIGVFDRSTGAEDLILRLRPPALRARELVSRTGRSARCWDQR
jgi:hypothetical protein